jgi:hypothetical protein
MIAWDDRLLSRHRAADMAGTWQIRLDGEFLRCGSCDMNLIRMPSGSLFTVDDVIASAVRHMSTTAHGYSLSGSADYAGKPDDGGALDAARSNRRSRRVADPVY